MGATVKANVWGCEAALKKGTDLRKALEQGANPNRKKSNGVFPLGEADALETKLLLAFGADVHMHDKSGCTALHEADYDKSVLVVAHGADVNAQDDKGATPLLWSSRYFWFEDKVRLLLDHGADPNIKTEAGHTALHEATSGGQIRTAESLLRHGADVHAKDNYGHTPLTCLGSIQSDMVELLLKNGADPTQKNWNGRTLYEQHKDNPWCDDKKAVEILGNAEKAWRSRETKWALLEGLGTAWKPSDCKSGIQSELEVEADCQKMRRKL